MEPEVFATNLSKDSFDQMKHFCAFKDLARRMGTDCTNPTRPKMDCDYDTCPLMAHYRIEKDTNFNAMF